ncbi:MAG: Gfo/Idh/MocA family oxidoreductase, partial [Planctomycetota bacterium]
MRVAIVGCGLIAGRRCKALAGCSLVACCDVRAERAQALARSAPGAEATSDWRATVNRPDVDLVIVATPHNMLAEIACAAAGAGKHV